MKLPQPHEIRKPSKTLAGVTPIAVMCKPRKCKHGVCLYCPSLRVPQSYTPKSPPVLRASLLKYDSFEQVKSRLKAFELMNHPIDKIEIIIMGGNFLDYPLKYQEEFVKGIYNALNCRKSKSLSEAKKRNEKAKHRCVALCIESRPDTILKKGVVKRILDFGCTRVELGVQCLDNKIYKKINRGHGIEEVVEATRLLRENGFKIGYHMMLGLPGSNKKKDIEMFKMLFKDSKFMPDQLKIYPCQVISGSLLSEWYKRGRYEPYSKGELLRLIIKIMKIIPNYCRVMRVMREIPPDYLVAGTTRIDLRRDVDEGLRKISGGGFVPLTPFEVDSHPPNPKSDKRGIQEIRFRELGFNLRDLKKGHKINEDLDLKITKYKASKGEEYFLEIVNKDNVLFGLCRLRIDSRPPNPRLSHPPNPRLSHPPALKKENKKQAFIRELHVYGQALGIGKRGKDFGQHRGLGKRLLKKAEEICFSERVGVLKIISGIGVREYFKKLGYKLDKEGIYMEKK